MIDQKKRGPILCQYQQKKIPIHLIGLFISLGGAKFTIVSINNGSSIIHLGINVHKLIMFIMDQIYIEMNIRNRQNREDFRNKSNFKAVRTKK